MKKRNIIRLTESDLHSIIMESVQKMMKESYEPCSDNIDIGELFANSELSYQYDEQEEGLGEMIGEKLSELFPNGVEIDVDWDDIPEDTEVGWNGGARINSATISENDANIIYQTFPQDIANNLIDMVNSEARDQAENY